MLQSQFRNRNQLLWHELAAWRRPTHIPSCVKAKAVRRKSGLGEKSLLNCLPWRQFAEVALPCLSPPVSPKLLSVRAEGERMGSAVAPSGRTPQGEWNQRPPLLFRKWTKTTTRWTPAHFCWSWLFRFTPTASKGQQVRPAGKLGKFGWAERSARAGRTVATGENDNFGVSVRAAW